MPEEMLQAGGISTEFTMEWGEIKMQKVQRLGLILALLMSFMMLASTAMAQQRANIGQMVSGLINVNIGAIQADIDTGDITLVNVEDVLNNNQIEALNNVLNNNTVVIENVNILNDLLREADILNDSQVVVGVLSGGQIVIQDLTS